VIILSTSWLSIRSVVAAVLVLGALAFRTLRAAAEEME